MIDWQPGERLYLEPVQITQNCLAAFLVLKIASIFAAFIHLIVNPKNI